MELPAEPDEDRQEECASEILKRAGFRLVGTFASEGSGVAYALHQPPEGNRILYAFVLDGHEVAFIGRTVRGLVADISSHFSNGPAVAYGRQCDWLIRQALESGQIVEIFALPEHEHLMLRGFIVDLGGAIEDSVVAKFHPTWNFLLSDWDSDSAPPAHQRDAQDK